MVKYTTVLCCVCLFVVVCFFLFDFLFVFGSLNIVHFGLPVCDLYTLVSPILQLNHALRTTLLKHNIETGRAQSTERFFVFVSINALHFFCVLLVPGISLQQDENV